MRQIVHNVARDDEWSGESDALDQNDVRFGPAMRLSACVDSGNVLEPRSGTSGRNARTCDVMIIIAPQKNYSAPLPEWTLPLYISTTPGIEILNSIRPYIVITGTKFDGFTTKKWRI